MKSSFVKKDYISISLIFISVFIFYYARNGFVEISGLLWAEDGHVFLSEVYRDGITSIFNQYAGYQHFYPRLISLIVYFTDISFAPIIFLIATLIPMFMLVAVTYRFICSLGINYILALFITLTAFFVPLTNEIYLNLTNIQWYIFILLFLVIIYEESRSFLPKYILYPLFVIFALTGPFSIYLLCVIVLKILLDKFKLDDITLCCIIFISSIVQVVTILLNDRVDDNISNELMSCMIFFGKILSFGSNKVEAQITGFIFFILLFIQMYKYIYAHVNIEKSRSFNYFIYIIFCIFIYTSSLLFILSDISLISSIGTGSRYLFPIYFLVILLIPIITKRRLVIISLLLLILTFWIVTFITNRINDKDVLYYFDYPKIEYPFYEYVNFAKVEKDIVIPINPFWDNRWYIDIGTKSRVIEPLGFTTNILIPSSGVVSISISDMIKSSCLLSKEFGVKLYISSEGSTNIGVQLVNSVSRDNIIPLKQLSFQDATVYSIATNINKYDTIQVIVYKNPITVNKVEVFCLKY